MADSVITRDQVREEDTWRLSDLFASDAAWEAALSAAAGQAQELSGMQGTIDRAERLFRALALSDAMHEQILRVYAFAKMHRDEDNGNSKYQGMTDRAARAMTDCAAAEAYLVPEITALGADTVAQWSKSCTELAVYAHFFENLFRERAHTLSAAEETLLARAAELGDAAGDVFEMWNDADLRFDTVTDEAGNAVALTHGRYGTLMQSHDRRVREQAFHAMYRPYRAWENTLAAMQAANVKKTCFFAAARHYESALHMALSADNIAPEVYHNLIDCMHEGIPALCDYLALRREMLGLSELHLYDLQVPLISIEEKKYTYEQAQKLVLAAVAPLGEEYCADMRRAFSERWVDVYENRGKTSGAYSWGSNDVHPYVLLNFQGTIGDVFTLAHEMGHAMHSYYTNCTQPPVYKNYKIFVAEVASTVNENLLMEYLLAHTDDARLRAFLIGHRLEEFRTTVYRQTMFAEFERETHAAFERGEALTAEYFNALYFGLNEKYMGGGAVIDPDIAWEWARIPHFYSDFYVYQYATGYSAAIALARGILRGGDAPARYRAFLKSGDSKYPLELLADAGVDLRTRAPICAALDCFRADLSAFRAMSANQMEKF